MIAKLKNDHDRLRGIADQLDVYLAQATAPIDAAFPQLRWMLVRELSLHLATERQVLTDWQARTGRELKQFDRGFDDAFALHVADWAGATISTAWQQYRVAAKMLLARLRARMDFEEGSVLPTVAAGGRR